MEFVKEKMTSTANASRTPIDLLIIDQTKFSRTVILFSTIFAPELSPKL